MSYVNGIRDAAGFADSDASLAAMAKDGVNCIALNPMQSQSTTTSTDIHIERRFLGSTDDAVIHTIRVAHQLGMKVLLKPMVNPRGRWRGDIPPSDEWFQAYTLFMEHYAVMADNEKVEALSVGCEFNRNQGDDAEWRRVIGVVRHLYHGPITYACNWDSYQKVTWWDAVDFIGVDFYYPLSRTPDPTADAVLAATAKIADSMDAWRRANYPQKKIVFTEIGYRSAPGTSMTPWESPETRPDPQEQRNCYNAVLQTFWDKPWWDGAFWWDWSPNPKGGGPEDKGYTPQNKPAEEVIRDYYGAGRTRN
jgi:hypothetical protein